MRQEDKKKRGKKQAGSAPPPPRLHAGNTPTVAAVPEWPARRRAHAHTRACAPHHKAGGVSREKPLPLLSPPPPPRRGTLSPVLAGHRPLLYTVPWGWINLHTPKREHGAPPRCIPSRPRPQAASLCVGGAYQRSSPTPPPPLPTVPPPPSASDGRGGGRSGGHVGPPPSLCGGGGGGRVVAPTPPPPPPPPPVIWRRMPIPQCPPPVIGAGCAPPQGLDTRARARARTVPISQSPLVRARLGPPRLELPPCRRLSQSGLPRARPCVVSGVLASQCALVCPRRGRGRGFGCRRGQPAQPRGVGSGPPWWGGGGSVRWAGGCTVGGLPLYAMTYSEDVLFFLLLVAAPSGGDAWTGEPHAPAQPTARRGGCALGGPWGGGVGGSHPQGVGAVAVAALPGGGVGRWRWWLRQDG